MDILLWIALIVSLIGSCEVVVGVICMHLEDRERENDEQEKFTSELRGKKQWSLYKRE